MKKLRYATAALIAAAAFPVAAQMRATPVAPWYIGVGAGTAHLNRDSFELTGLTNSSLDSNETSYTVRAGWRFNPYAALEVGYYDLGKYAFHGNAGAVRIDGEFKAKAAGIAFVGILPIDAFDLYGRLGWSRAELKANVGSSNFGGSLNAKDKENGAMYGIGGRWNFGPSWGLFAEWMKHDKIRVDGYTVGVDFKF
jgi:OOP family OmpA-OmpF porin